MNWIAINKFVNDAVPVPGPVDPKAQPIPGVHNMLEDRLLPYWNTVPGRRAISKLQERVGKGVDPIQAIADDDLREHLAMLDIEAVYCRYTPALKAVYDAIADQRKRLIGGKRLFPGSSLYPPDWWPAKDGPAGPPPESVPEELRPEGEGWVFEVRGSTYWHPNQTAETEKFIMDTLLRNLIARSRPYTEDEKNRMTPEQLKKAEEDPIRGKVSHVFLYTLPNGGEDKNPSPNSFRYIRASLIDPLVTAAGTGTGDSAGGASGYGSPGGMGMPMMPG